MKKLLLGTSALIGATAMVASAQAAAPELTISGNLDFRITAGDVPAFNNGTGVTGRTSVTGPSALHFSNTNSRSEIRFRAVGESDGGTSYGANIDFRYLESDDTASSSAVTNQTDEAYIFAGGDWGRVHLGQDDGALDALVPNAGWIAPGAFLIDDTTTSIAMETHSNVDDNKITYFSPDFGGFDFAVSYSPVLDGFTDAIELSARYSTDFGDGGFTVGVGYQRGDSDTATERNLSEWVIGATVNFGQFSIAASYNDAGRSNTVAFAANTGLADAREMYSLGVAYDIGGGLGVGISYGEQETGTHGATAGVITKSKDRIITVDFGFPIMEGMAGYAGAAFTRSGGGANAGTYVLGTTVSF